MEPPFCGGGYRTTSGRHPASSSEVRARDFGPTRVKSGRATSDRLEGGAPGPGRMTKMVARRAKMVRGQWLRAGSNKFRALAPGACRRLGGGKKRPPPLAPLVLRGERARAASSAETGPAAPGSGNTPGRDVKAGGGALRGVGPIGNAVGAIPPGPARAGRGDHGRSRSLLRKPEQSRARLAADPGRAGPALNGGSPSPPIGPRGRPLG